MSFKSVRTDLKCLFFIFQTTISTVSNKLAITSYLVGQTSIYLDVTRLGPRNYEDLKQANAWKSVDILMTFLETPAI